MKTEEAIKHIIPGKTLSPEQALMLFEKADLLELANAADAVRRDKHPEGIVTFLIDRNINYTNILSESMFILRFFQTQGTSRSLCAEPGRD